ncbi:Methyltransferase domain-containing protein [Algoriphagus faecimaris]|uniref:Methyltransferase domain-containing protein n=1 Tax=Algoriphagus faecimaris TaxID=686796 RepID=A0A1G6PUJ3_9BACT|nr:class I SAM-dependent methyltransferase [Algoriphagus faecimaris]SDC83067.1 Methyltransferase domain-containing protein [Algoriphagus faecimaris]
MLNKLRYYFRKVKGDISANEYIYYPKDIFSDMDDVDNVDNVFNKIYSKNTWGSTESASGRGSEIQNTKTLLKKLDRLTKEFGVKSMLDAPCGDFNWMQHLDRKGISYIGMDIVEDLIDILNVKYAEDPQVTFQAGNIIAGELPQVDLIFCRDCLVHFSFDDIYHSLSNFKNSGSKYLLTTSYTDRGVNRDIQTGGWRPINLEKEPFNLPKPRKIIHENNLDDQGIYFDKCMALWKLSEIQI